MRIAISLAIAAVLAALAAGAAESKQNAPRLLLKSAVGLNAKAGTVTLPLFKGSAGGKDVWYVVTESSNRADARTRGVTWSPRLANALGTKAVQAARLQGSTLAFAGTVNFRPKTVVVPGDEGFPPASVKPGAIGDARYSPLVTTGNGVVLNATHVANATGRSDSVTALDTAKRRVTLKLLNGFFAGQMVHYLRTDASVDVVAALEGSTLATNLDAAPGAGSNSARSARSGDHPDRERAAGEVESAAPGPAVGRARRGQPAERHSVPAGEPRLQPDLGRPPRGLERVGDAEAAHLCGASGSRGGGRPADERRDGAGERQPRRPEGGSVHLQLPDGRDRLTTGIQLLVRLDGDNGRDGADPGRRRRADRARGRGQVPRPRGACDARGGRRGRRPGPPRAQRARPRRPRRDAARHGRARALSLDPVALGPPRHPAHRAGRGGRPDRRSRARRRRLRDEAVLAPRARRPRPHRAAAVDSP